MPANTEGQVGRGSEQPDLVEDVSAHLRVARLDDLKKSLLIRPIV